MDGHQAPPPPPPPPPHGANPKSTAGGAGLPPGNYDIFIIPPHSSGSGFLYLPSLRPQMNSFIAGAASAFFACWLWMKLSPMLKGFVSTVSQSGAGLGMVIIVGVVGAAAFFAGSGGQLPNAGGNAGPAPGAGQAPPHGYAAGGTNAGQPPNGYASHGSRPNGFTNAAPNGHAGGPGQQHWNQQGGYTNDYAQSPPPPPPPPRTEPYGARSEADGSERAQPRPRAYSNASASWQKAKEEQRRREEERKKEEEAKRKAEEEAKAKAEAERKTKAAEEKARWEKQRAREKEERERKERERLARERLEKAKAEIERARMEKEIKEKLEKERLEKEAAAAKEKAESERAAREAAARERLAELKAKSDVGATPSKFGVGERTNPYSLDPNDRTPTPAATAAQAASRKYEKPTAQSYVGTSTAESYRPYDRHKHTGSGSSIYSESYQSTAPSTAPPSQRGPYSTTDPDKVVIKAVYSFSDSFPKPQTSLIAGQDGVTDGLILKIGTEGMFVDDDVKGIGLREWDVKTWTMKSVETLSIPKKALFLVRATIKDAVKTNFVFVIASSEEWKAKKGVEILKGGSLARTGLASTMASGEAQRLLTLLGW